MRMRHAAVVVGLAFVLISGQASAALLQYEISGTGSGSLNSQSFDNISYTIDLIGDSSNYKSLNPVVDAIQPLTTGTISITGFREATINIPLQIGTAKVSGRPTAVFLGRAGRADLLDFRTNTSLDLLSTFGPIVGNGLFALNQFKDVPTSEGYLTLSSSSDVEFSGQLGVSAVPLPTSAPMFGAALLGLAGLGYAAKRKKAAAAA